MLLKLTEHAKNLHAAVLGKAENRFKLQDIQKDILSR